LREDGLAVDALVRHVDGREVRKGLSLLQREGGCAWGEEPGGQHDGAGHPGHSESFTHLRRCPSVGGAEPRFQPVERTPIPGMIFIHAELCQAASRLVHILLPGHVLYDTIRVHEFPLHAPHPGVASRGGRAMSPPPPAQSAEQPETIPAPQWVGVTGVRGKALLTWIRSPRHALVRIYRRLREEGSFTRAGESDGNTFVDTGVVSGQTYVFRLVGVDSAGREGRPSAEATARIPGEERRPASPPSWDGALLLDGGSDCGGPGARKEDVLAFNIYRRGAGETELRLIGSSRGTNFMDADVEPEKEYVYALTALDSSFQETPRSEELAVRYVRGVPSPRSLPRCAGACGAPGSYGRSRGGTCPSSAPRTWRSGRAPGCSTWRTPATTASRCSTPRAGGNAP